MILIKKYSNRRLYDTSRSQYVTLEELADRIRMGDDVQVQDAKTNEDLTQSVLAQIIIESRGAARLLPTRMLTQLIRMEDDALAEFFGHYMSWALSLYLKARRSAQRINPFGAALAQGAAAAAAQTPPFAPPGPFTQWLSAMYGWPAGAQSSPQHNPFGGSAHHAARYHEPPFEEEDEPPFEEEELPPIAPAPRGASRGHASKSAQPAPQPQPTAQPAAPQQSSGEVAQLRRELDEIKSLLRHAVAQSYGAPQEGAEQDD